MNDNHSILARLNDRATIVRLKAIQQLELESALPQEAIDALRQASNDPDPIVAEAAGHALSVHSQKYLDSIPVASSPPNSSVPTNKPSMIGNLALNHWLFLIGGSIMFILVSRDSWAGGLFILLFLGGCIALMGIPSVNKHKKLIAIWAEFARHTDLDLDPGRMYYIGNSIPPSVSGIYRNRKVSISKYVRHQAAYEGSIPVVFTCMSLEVKNLTGASLTINSKSFMNRLFGSRGVSSGDHQLDEHYQIDGQPDNFIRSAVRLIALHRELLERPKGIIMRTDYPLSTTNWTRPSIYLKESQLVCFQSGVPTNIPNQVRLLNLLCDIAEIAEYAVPG